MTIKNLLQRADLNLAEVRRLQNSLSSVRKETLRKDKQQIAIITTVDGKFTIEGNYYWIQFPAGIDVDGLTLYSAPVPVRAPSNGFPVKEWVGFPVTVGIGNDKQLEIQGVDSPTFIGSGGIMRTLNPLRSENFFVYLHDVVAFQSRPVGTLNNPSTVVQVRKLWYDDGYGDINRWKGTELASEMIDLASNIPGADLHRIVVLFYDTFNDSIQITQSSTRAITDPIQKPVDYQECFLQRKAETMPIQAYKLGNIQSSIDITALDIDLRQFLNTPRALGFPNPIIKDQRIRSGRTVSIHGGLNITNGELHIIGELNLLPNRNVLPGYETLVEINDTNSPYSPGKEKNVTADTTTNNVIIKLGPLNVLLKKVYTFKNIGTGTMILQGNNSDTIDGSSTLEVSSQYDAVKIIGTSIEWSII